MEELDKDFENRKQQLLRELYSHNDTIKEEEQEADFTKTDSIQNSILRPSITNGLSPINSKLGFFNQSPSMLFQGHSNSITKLNEDSQTRLSLRDLNNNKLASDKKGQSFRRRDPTPKVFSKFQHLDQSID